MKLQSFTRKQKVSSTAESVLAPFNNKKMSKYLDNL